MIGNREAHQTTCRTKHPQSLGLREISFQLFMKWCGSKQDEQAVWSRKHRKHCIHTYAKTDKKYTQIVSEEVKLVEIQIETQVQA